MPLLAVRSAVLPCTPVRFSGCVRRTAATRLTPRCAALQEQLVLCSRRQASLVAATGLAIAFVARPPLAAAAPGGVADSAPAFELPSTKGGSLSLVKLVGSRNWTVLLLLQSRRAEII